VLFNAHAGVLWRRFTTYLPRHLARLSGLTQKRLRALARVRYVKVTEYQARGVVHFHAVIRLDAPGEDYQPPPARFTTSLLCDAIRQAAAAVAVTIGPGSHSAWPALTLRFGAQVDIKPLVCGDRLPGLDTSCRSKRSGTTSPSTPPKLLMLPACRNSRCGPPKTWQGSAATVTTGR
jgi:hypothetical protein